MTIETVTFGKEHFYGSVWQKFLTRALPTNVTARLGIKVNRITRTEDELMVWVGTNASQYGFNNTMVAIDDQGHEGKPAALRVGSGYCVYPLSWFPRREKMLKLRVFTWGGKGPQFMRDQVMEFVIKNPVYKKYPEWKPEPLPITKRVGDEQFTLLALNTGLSPTGGLGAQVLTWSELEFRNGPLEAPTGPWKPIWFSICDATGNAREPHSPMGALAADAQAQKAMHARNAPYGWRYITESGMLWLDEAAWKINVTWVRDRGYPFRPEQLWTVKGVTNPAPHTVTEVNARTNAPIGSLLLQGINAAHTAYPGEKNISTNAAIHVKFEPSDTNALAELTRVTDDRGSNIFFGPPRGNAYPLARLTTNSKTLDLTFAFHRKYQVQFLAKPTLLHTNLEKSE
jgi:hypothetical protein